jgi:hypothetical protein
MTSPATYTRTRTSQEMTVFLRRMEQRYRKQYKRDMTQAELRSELFKAAARVYAEMVLELETKSDKEKG